MTKRRGWFCNICGVLVASVGKNLMLAIEQHKRKCPEDGQRIVTVSMKNTDD